jgi:hypothetical protein
MYGRALGSFLLLVTLASSARGDTVTLTSVKDNTIFSESGGLSDGVGSEMYSGRILNNGGPFAAPLLAFDVSSVPTDVVIDSVRLELSLTKSPDLTPGRSASIVSSRIGERGRQTPRSGRGRPLSPATPRG